MSVEVKGTRSEQKTLDWYLDTWSGGNVSVRKQFADELENSLIYRIKDLEDMASTSQWELFLQDDITIKLLRAKLEIWKETFDEERLESKSHFVHFFFCLLIYWCHPH
jgi:hypothetical protein